MAARAAGFQDMSHVFLPYVIVVFSQIRAARRSIVRGNTGEFKPQRNLDAYDFRMRMRRAQKGAGASEACAFMEPA